MTAHPFFIGTHAALGQPAIQKCTVDFEAERFETLYTVESIPDPTYLAAGAGRIYALGSSGGGTVYELEETPALKETEPDKSGEAPKVSAGGLSVLGSASSGKKGPCHISLDPRGGFLLCANYGGGSISLFDLDGGLKERCDERIYSGTGYDCEDRQSRPHAHFAAFGPERDEVLACDLGLDRVMVYTLDRSARRLADTDRSIRLPDGSGPRHLAFHAAHPGMLYVITEMANTIFVYRYDPALGKYVQIQSVSAVPAGPGSAEVSPPDPALMLPASADNGSVGCAIRFCADGRFLFVSSRLGYQSISAFCCEEDGRLSFCSRCLCGGITPRDFNVFEGDASPDQGGGPVCDYILTANQDSDLITALRFDRKTRSLSLLDMKMQAVRPTCILPV